MQGQLHTIALRGDPQQLLAHIERQLGLEVRHAERTRAHGAEQGRARVPVAEQGVAGVAHERESVQAGVEQRGDEGGQGVGESARAPRRHALDRAARVREGGEHALHQMQVVAAGGQRCVIAIQNKNQLPTTLPIL